MMKAGAVTVTVVGAVMTAKAATAVRAVTAVEEVMAAGAMTVRKGGKMYRWSSLARLLNSW